MKPFYILTCCICLLFSLNMQAQNFNSELPTQGIDPKYILLEEFTGSWCNNCPNTAQAIDTFFKHNLPIATIAYQIEIAPDMMKYYIIANAERSGFYDTVRSIPDVFFNGNLHSSMGFGDAGIRFKKYRLLYDSCMKQKTAYDLKLSMKTKRYDLLHLDSLFVEIRVDKIAQDTSKNLALHLAMTQNHIEKKWYNLTELNHVNRRMFPSASGIPINFTQNNTHIEKYAFAIPDSAQIPLKDLVFIGFLQENTFLGYDTTRYEDGQMYIQAKYNRKVQQTDLFDFSKSPIAIEQTINSCQLKVYPNPSVNGLFYLSKGETTHTYSVFDLFGREILKAGANTHSLDLSQYAKGMYLLQVITPKGVGKTIKLLKN